MLVAAAILYLSLASGSGLPKISVHVPNADKLVHMCMYFGLALTLTCDLYRSRVRRPVLLVWAILLPVLYGGTIELIQPFFPPRTAEWLDFMADFTGALLGFLAVDTVFLKIRKKG